MLNAASDDELILLPFNEASAEPLANLATKIMVDKMRIFAPIVFTSVQVQCVQVAPVYGHDPLLSPLQVNKLCLSSWIEAGADVVTIKDDSFGRIDVDLLQKELG